MRLILLFCFFICLTADNGFWETSACQTCAVDTTKEVCGLNADTDPIPDGLTCVEKNSTHLKTHCVDGGELYSKAICKQPAWCGDTHISIKQDTVYSQRINNTVNFGECVYVIKLEKSHGIDELDINLSGNPFVDYTITPFIWHSTNFDFFKPGTEFLVNVQDTEHTSMRFNLDTEFVHVAIVIKFAQ